MDMMDSRGKGWKNTGPCKKSWNKESNLPNLQAAISHIQPQHLIVLVLYSVLHFSFSNSSNTQPSHFLTLLTAHCSTLKILAMDTALVHDVDFVKEWLSSPVLLSSPCFFCKLLSTFCASAAVLLLNSVIPFFCPFSTFFLHLWRSVCRYFSLLSGLVHSDTGIFITRVFPPFV